MSDLVYVTCPACEERIPEPFTRESGPVAFVHRRSHRRSCRLVVVPDPSGERHRRVQVPPSESLEAAVLRELRAGGRL